MASKKKMIRIEVPKDSVVELALDDEEFNKLINRLQTIINFANGANESLCNLKGNLASISFM